nr:hypothetical protein pSG1.24 [Sodalis glossinidius]CAI59466.1 hypothetical protein pSG1.24 [Sodalis glossinidius]
MLPFRPDCAGLACGYGSARHDSGASGKTIEEVCTNRKHVAEKAPMAQKLATAGRDKKQEQSNFLFCSNSPHQPFETQLCKTQKISFIYILNT